jgi:hypothetical protein
LRKHPQLFAPVFLISTLLFVLQPIQTFAATAISSQPVLLPVGEHDPNASCLPLSADSENWLSRRTRVRLNLPQFVASVSPSDPTTVIGVFVCSVLALQVTQQPADDPVFVSETPGTATQFRLAAGYGTIGLLAHSQRAGSRFFELAAGQEVNIVYGDGAVKRYVVSEIRHMRSLNPNDPYSDFLDLEHDGTLLSSAQVFNQIFAKAANVVFQTCIEREASPTWGRLFVTATRVSDERY